VQYHFRRRSHDKLLIPKTADLSDREFIIRLLYKDCYWHFYILSFLSFYIVLVACVNFLLKIMMMMMMMMILTDRDPRRSPYERNSLASRHSFRQYAAQTCISAVQR